MKIISYSLYNERPKDIVNAIVNCFLAEKIYKGWTCIFHIDHTIPTPIRQALETFDNVQLREGPPTTFMHPAFGPDPQKMMWRFLPASQEDIEVVIFRDADSWLSYRELVCVDDFIKSDKNLHIIRDHCYHGHKIMGGMWGIKKGALPNIEQLMGDFLGEIQRGDRPMPETAVDQVFLADQVYEKCINTKLIHLGDQHDNGGNRLPHGYFNDGGIPIPPHGDTEFENFSFIEVNAINGFHCAHCNKVHETFIGGIMERIPAKTKEFLYEYACSHNLGHDPQHAKEWWQHILEAV